MRITIRLATRGDLKEYTNLLQATYEDAYTDESLGLTKECFSKEVFATDNTQKYLKSHLVNTNKQKTWLAFIRSKMIGAVTCIIKNKNEAELTGFYVAPEYQGKGIGKKLYRLAMEFADGRSLVLDIYTHSTKTIEMYKKWGWKLNTSRGDNGYFFRHWPEWPGELEAECMYMRLTNYT